MQLKTQGGNHLEVTASQQDDELASLPQLGVGRLKLCHGNRALDSD